MNTFLDYFIISIAMGTLGRFYLLRVDYRQYPSYPRGVIMHLTFGFIGAALGSIAVPALIAKDFAAVTFLALAAEQFRNIRTMERENLNNIEDYELVPRGKSYIEEIAKIFEARNYIVAITSLATSMLLYIFDQIVAGIVGGMVVLIILKLFMKGQKIQDIAKVRIGKIWFKNALLYVDDVVIMNVGLKEARERIIKTGIAVVLEPVDENASITLSNIGQRQAIIHDAIAQVGIKKDLDEPDFTPLARRNINNGNLMVVFYPSIQDEKALLRAVRYAPVLESSRRKPSESGAAYSKE
ncbi:YIEGIA family protein [Petroclostridium sp. X23]|uniref:YIEGIA family protein n=1 Tax=Petroclostridium sp. X23 TaxID=3045146 RepID=UPI0024AD5679|nr:YIEGIA family protein [Petroclostridium sp. X23]WHH59870.1 YIEGIA family protein [Petroclostridium sp. X23]